MKSDDTWSHQVKTYAATILFAQVKFIPSEKFLDDLTNPYSLGNKTAHHFKIENKVSSFWMTYKQDVAFRIKQKRGNVQECITKDFKSQCIVICSSLLLKISLLRLSWIPSPLGLSIACFSDIIIKMSFLFQWIVSLIVYHILLWPLAQWRHPLVRTSQVFLTLSGGKSEILPEMGSS